MKILHQRNYKYVGSRDNMHVFISIRKDFDPEIVLLKNAKFILNDGEVIYYDPIMSKSTSQPDFVFHYKGTDSEGNSFDIPILVESQRNVPLAERVNQVEREGRIPKRRNVRYDNLIKSPYGGESRVMVN